tara:strand:- start:1042 stop:1362 length:321 start_codon:yes stop_codon:yes gene_type:complete
MALNQKQALLQVVSISQIIGTGNTLLLYELLGQGQFYFPKVETIVKVLSRRDLIAEIKKTALKKRKRNGREIIKLAEKYNMTPVGIYKKLEKYKKILEKNPDIEFL